MEVISIDISKKTKDSHELHVGKLVTGVKSRISFLKGRADIGYIDYSITGASAKLSFLEVREAFRGGGISDVLISTFFDLLLESCVKHCWTESYTKMGKDRRGGKTQKIAEEKGIDFTGGVQSC